MKIIIHSLDELLQLSELVTYGKMPREVRTSSNIERSAAYDMHVRCDEVVGRVPTSYDEPNGLPSDIEPPVNNRGQTYDEVVAATAKLHEAIISETLDADRVAHNTDWHSEPAKINADGRWKARRGRDNDAYKAWLLQQAMAVAEAAWTDEAEPVATETHALPLHSTDAEMDAALSEDAAKLAALGADPGPTLAELEEPQAPASTVDLEALIAASLEAAQDASDSHVDLLNACRDFTSKHGHPAFTALKVTVAPEDAGGGGKAVQHFTPGERRLMQACIANYPTA